MNIYPFDVSTPQEDSSYEESENCRKREDAQHCNCWYDGEKCCACGAPALPESESSKD